MVVQNELLTKTKDTVSKNNESMVCESGFDRLQKVENSEEIRALVKWVSVNILDIKTGSKRIIKSKN